MLIDLHCLMLVLVVVEVHTHLEAEGIDIYATEREIAAKINDLFRNRSAPEFNRILEMALEMKLIGAKQSHSISLYFLCNQSREVDHLEELSRDGRLKEFVESLFNHVIKAPKKIRIRIERRVNVFSICREILQGKRETPMQELRTNDKELPLITTINCLPLEVLDVILQKSYLGIIQRSANNIWGARDEEIVKHLAKVNFCWFKRMTKPRFKSAVWSFLSSFYQSKCQFSFIYKYNQQFLEENFGQLRSDELKSSNVFSDIEYAIITRNTSSAIKKNHSMYETLSLSLSATSSDQFKLSAFVRYLRQARRDSMAKVIENRGVSIKVEIRSRDKNRVEWRQEFVNRSNDLKGKSISRVFETKNTVTNLDDDDDIELLNAVEDRDAVLWIWCESGNALEKLKEMNDSKVFAQMFCRMTKDNLQFINENDIHIDKDQLRNSKEVFPPMIAKFVATLDFQEKLNKDDYFGIKGVTKLGDTIFVICCVAFDSSSLSDYSEIYVFYDRNPFALQKKIKYSDLKNPLDIVSNETENAIYILEAFSMVLFSIWKLEPDEPINEGKLVKLLDLPYNFRPSWMSMSNDGQLVLVSRNRPVILKVYRSDAQLCLSTRLHQNIVNPLHAAKTSTGNFIICHLTWKEKSEENVEHGLMLMISELSPDGREIIRNFTPENEEQRLSISPHAFESYIFIDSYDRVFVADPVKNRVILLDHELRWKQIIVLTAEEKEGKSGQKILRCPLNFFYDEKYKQLVVADRRGRLSQVNVYNMF